MNVQPVSITNYKSNLQEFRAAPVFTAKLKPMSAKQCSELKVFCHHIYEYKKRFEKSYIDNRENFK